VPVINNKDIRAGYGRKKRRRIQQKLKRLFYAERLLTTIKVLSPKEKIYQSRKISRLRKNLIRQSRIPGKCSLDIWIPSFFSSKTDRRCICKDTSDGFRRRVTRHRRFCYFSSEKILSFVPVMVTKKGFGASKEATLNYPLARHLREPSGSSTRTLRYESKWILVIANRWRIGRFFRKFQLPAELQGPSNGVRSPVDFLKRFTHGRPPKGTATRAAGEQSKHKSNSPPQGRGRSQSNLRGFLPS